MTKENVVVRLTGTLGCILGMMVAKTMTGPPFENLLLGVIFGTYVGGMFGLVIYLKASAHKVYKKVAIQ